MNVTKIVFLDTNIYLHYQFFDQIKWPKILDASKIIIVVPPITIRELNKHKDLHPRQHVKERAAKVIKKFLGLFKADTESEINTSVKIYFEDREPAIDFSQFQLERDIQDDQLIASILTYKNEHLDSDIILVTSDSGLLLIGKARRLNISAIELPNELKLADEPDPDQIRIKHLERKIRELESKIPQLSLTFEDGSQHLTFTLKRPFELNQKGLEHKINKIKKQYPQIINNPNHKAPETLGALAELIVGMNSSFGNTLAPEDIVKYNLELDKFYQSYSEYVERYILYQNILSNSIILSIYIKNDGSVPAEDVDIFLHFPNGFRLTDKQGFPHAPKLPKTPEKPSTPLQKIQGSINHAYIMPPISPISALSNYELPSVDLPSRNVSSPNITQTKSYDVDFHVQRIKHLMKEPVEPLYIIFESFENAKPFHIDYKLLAANIPDEVVGKLHVVINKGEI